MQGGKRTAPGVNVVETKFWIPQTFSYTFNNNNATDGILSRNTANEGKNTLVFAGRNQGNYRTFAVTADGRVQLSAANRTEIFSGHGSPEGIRTAPKGSLYLRYDGGANTTLYVKESGAGATGWVAK